MGRDSRAGKPKAHPANFRGAGKRSASRDPMLEQIPHRRYHAHRPPKAARLERYQHRAVSLPHPRRPRGGQLAPPRDDEDDGGIVGGLTAVVADRRHAVLSLQPATGGDRRSPRRAARRRDRHTPPGGYARPAEAPRSRSSLVRVQPGPRDLDLNPVTEAPRTEAARGAMAFAGAEPTRLGSTAIGPGIPSMKSSC